MNCANDRSSRVWILTDDKALWTKRFMDYGFIKATVVVSEAKDAIASLSNALDCAIPKYALYFFPKAKTVEFCEDLNLFLSVCKEKGIIPVLATYPELASKKKNAAIIASGEKIVDLASLTNAEKIRGGKGYTNLGLEAICAKILVDFPEIITPDIKVRKGGASLPDGAKLSLGANKVRDGKYLIFTARLDGELKAGEKITVGHGYMEAYGRWFEIDTEATYVCSYTSWAAVPYKDRKVPHKLTIKNYVTVIISSDIDGAGESIYLVTDGGFVKRTGHGWAACQGEIYVKTEGAELTDVKLSWTCEDYSAPIWFVGASYFSLCDPARWPYYMYADDYKKRVFITGRGGMNGINGHEEIADALKYGKPECMVWGIGMNDGPDVDGDINPKTYDNKVGFLKICKENGIKPIFMTIPNCGNENNQRNDNTYKLDYVINRRGEFANYDYRVIDIAHAVNGIEPHAPWYPNMLHTDGTHPTKLGARNFYLELLCHFPELMLGTDIKIFNNKADELKAGSAITVENQGNNGEYAITLSANFSGALDGCIELGSKEGSYLKIDLDKIVVYNKENPVFEIANEKNMEELLMIRLHVKDGKANVALVSSGDKEYDPKLSTLFKFEADFEAIGEIYAKADKTDLTLVDLKYSTK